MFFKKRNIIARFWRSTVRGFQSSKALPRLNQSRGAKEIQNISWIWANQRALKWRINKLNNRGHGLALQTLPTM